MYTTRISYLLWLASFFGAAGLHRLYLGKIGSGIVYLFTWGLFGFGTIYDGITMPDQVREANLRLRMRGMLDDEFDEDAELGYRRNRGLPDTGRSPRSTESPEHVILRVAKANHGLASPAEIALEGNLSTDAAREQLDSLVDKGIGEVRVRKNGTLVYVFLDFLDDQGSADLEPY
ncbi:MAG: TM2 domain-containing protein [Spirochaetia bacterium]